MTPQDPKHIEKLTAEVVQNLSKSSARENRLRTKEEIVKQVGLLEEILNLHGKKDTDLYGSHIMGAIQALRWAAGMEHADLNNFEGVQHGS